MNDMQSAENICPVCGYDKLTEAPYDEDGMPSYEICDCCGFEFGFDDLSEGETYSSYREKWICNGAVWFSKKKVRQGSIIDSTKKLKDFIPSTEYKDILKNAEQYPDMPLPNWHLSVIEMRLSDLSEFDLIRCIRQGIFTNLAVYETIKRMIVSGTPFYAGSDSVELMEKLSSVSPVELSLYKNELARIIVDIERDDLIENADVWMFKEQKDRYQKYIDTLKDIIS